VRFWTNYSTEHAEKCPYLIAYGFPAFAEIFYLALHRVAPMPDRFVADVGMNASEGTVPDGALVRNNATFTYAMWSETVSTLSERSWRQGTIWDYSC
jgi:hypothetical protein